MGRWDKGLGSRTFTQLTDHDVNILHDVQFVLKFSSPGHPLCSPNMWHHHHVTLFGFYFSFVKTILTPDVILQVFQNCHLTIMPATHTGCPAPVLTTQFSLHLFKLSSTLTQSFNNLLSFNMLYFIVHKSPKYQHQQQILHRSNVWVKPCKMNHMDVTWSPTFIFLVFQAWCSSPASLGCRQIVC